MNFIVRGIVFYKLLILFCIFFSVINADEYYSEHDLGNGQKLLAKNNGNFIEDEHGNTCYAVTAEFYGVQGPIDNPVGNPGYSSSRPATSFRRECAQDVSWVFAVSNMFNRWNSKPHRVGEIPPYIGRKNSFCPGQKNRYIQELSMYEYSGTNGGRIKLRKPKNLIKKYCSMMGNRLLKIKVDWDSTASSICTLDDLDKEIDRIRRKKDKKLRRLESVFGENYLNLFANNYRKELLKKYDREVEKRFINDPKSKYFYRSNYKHEHAKKVIKELCNCANIRIPWDDPKLALDNLGYLKTRIDKDKEFRKDHVDHLKKEHGGDYIDKYIKYCEEGIRDKRKFYAERLREEDDVKKLAKGRSNRELGITKRVDKWLSEFPQVSQVSSDEVSNSDEGQWLRSELKLQVQDNLIKLSDKQVRELEVTRNSLNNQKHIEASHTYLKMIKEAEIGIYQHDGSISKKLYNRLNALEQALLNGFRSRDGKYQLNNYAKIYVQDHLNNSNKKLEKYNGNEVQHNVHGEIVGFINRSSYYLHANNCKDFDLFEAANIALEMRDKVAVVGFNPNGKKESIKTKIYERTYSFLDFCHNYIRAKAGKMILYLVHRGGSGLSDGGDDIRRVLHNSIKNYISDDSLAEKFDIFMINYKNMIDPPSHWVFK